MRGVSQREDCCFPLGCWSQLHPISASLCHGCKSHWGQIHPIPPALCHGSAWSLDMWVPVDVCRLLSMVRRSPPLGCHLSCLHDWRLTQTAREWAAPPVYPGQAEPHHRQSLSRQSSQVSESWRKCFQSCRENLHYHFGMFSEVTAEGDSFSLPARQAGRRPCCAEFPSIFLSRVWGRIRPNVSGWHIHMQ